MARSDGDGLSRRQLLALTIGVWGIFFATLVVIAASLFYASTAWFWFFIADVAASTVLISLAILDARRRRRRDPTGNRDRGIRLGPVRPSNCGTWPCGKASGNSNGQRIATSRSSRPTEMPMTRTDSPLASDSIDAATRRHVRVTPPAFALSVRRSARTYHDRVSAKMK
jgi:hypothetical protein